MPRKTHAARLAAVFDLRASMRPRPDAAENSITHPQTAPQTFAGFNEAAARCRGKLTENVQRAGLTPLASMRPRPDAAENAVGQACVLGSLTVLQ